MPPVPVFHHVRAVSQVTSCMMLSVLLHAQQATMHLLASVWPVHREHTLRLVQAPHAQVRTFHNH